MASSAVDQLYPAPDLKLKDPRKKEIKRSADSFMLGEGVDMFWKQDRAEKLSSAFKTPRHTLFQSLHNITASKSIPRAEAEHSVNKLSSTSSSPTWGPFLDHTQKM